MSIYRRILAERRGVLIPLVIALLANIGVYVLVVYPLGVKSANAAERAVTAAQAREGAERDMLAAESLVSGKAKADQELKTFYTQVLPSTLDEARRMTFSRLPALARKANMRFTERRMEVDDQLDKTSQLGRLKTRMVLDGSYESIRQFLYELETTPEFIIVDDVTLGQLDPEKPVQLTVEISTYFRQARSGT